MDDTRLFSLLGLLPLLFLGESTELSCLLAERMELLEFFLILLLYKWAPLEALVLRAALEWTRDSISYDIFLTFNPTAYTYLFCTELGLSIGGKLSFLLLCPRDFFLMV